ncbi:hypothetical protein EVA_13830 [gut metagenome]|uniref:Uncharacterized protein n=1 Tax=gut metagenome TaxID=749906 RepID=J9CDQ1_9ZZZZ
MLREIYRGISILLIQLGYPHRPIILGWNRHLALR